jgi:hypothetical protein
VWAGADFGTAAYAAIINEVTSNADSPVIAILSIGSTLTQGGSLTVQFGSFALKLSA